jgi:protein-disulfide isomerase
VAVAVVALLVAAPVLASDKKQEELKQGIEGLKQEIEALKQGQQEILKQMEEIKKLVQARPAAPAGPAGPNVKDVVFSLGSNPVQGSATAGLTLVEFTDYQ